eukprot:366390_1
MAFKGKKQKKKQIKEEKEDNTIKLPGNDVTLSVGAQNVIASRHKPPYGIGDAQYQNIVTKQDWKQLARQHYDWWMFPWAGNSNSFGIKYKMDKSDYFILQSNNEFMTNYIFGLNAMISAKKNGVNAMTSNFVSSRRVLKIIVSMTSFRNAAKLIQSKYFQPLDSCLKEMYQLWPELSGKGKNKINLKLIQTKMKDFGIPNDAIINQ